MAKRISKEELKTDAFLETGDRALRFLEDKWPAILAVVIVLVIAGASYAGYEQWSHYREEKAQDEVFAWTSKLEKKQEELARKAQESVKVDPKNPEAPAAMPEIKADYETDYAALVTGLENEIKENKKTVAGQAAAMKLADFLVEQKRVEQASGLLKEVEPGLDKGSWIYGLFKVQFASLLSQTGKSEEALQELTKITEEKSAKFLHPEVFLKMAVLQEELGHPEKAKEIYARVSTEYGDTEAGKSAQSMSRLLEIQEKLNPVPAKDGASL